MGRATRNPSSMSFRVTLCSTQATCEPSGAHKSMTLTPLIGRLRRFGEGDKVKSIIHGSLGFAVLYPCRVDLRVADAFSPTVALVTQATCRWALSFSARIPGRTRA